MHTLRSLSLLIAAVLLLAAAPVRATVLLYMSTQELTDQSTVVVEATVLHQEVIELDHLYTDTYVLVSGEVHKGAVTPGQILVVRQIGGVTSGISLQVAGMARFKLGEQALIFAAPAKGPKSERRFMVMGAALGKYTLFNDADGVRRARRDLSSASVANFGPNGQFKVGQANAALEKERPTLKDLRTEVSRCVAKKPIKPVNPQGGAK
jgi:hypothetical protein